jgi:zinc/manganese transport system substrate-binding protein
MLHRTILAWLGCVGAVLLCGADARAQDGAEPKLQVVTTTGVLAGITRAVGGERVEVLALSSPRQDPHFVEPRPTLMQRARAADVFVEIGLQLELWAQKVVDGSGNPRIQGGQPGRIVASQGIATLELPTSLSREWGDVHPSGNPHVWLDPLNAGDMADNIAAGLARVDPAHAAEYAQRAEAFRRDVDERLFGRELCEEIGAAKLARLARQGRLDDYLASHDLAGKLGGWLARAKPLHGRPIVTYHKTFVYLAERFGLRIAAEIEEKPGIPPAARHRDAVLALMKEEGVRTILQEVFYERTAADYLAERAGARVAVVPIDIGEDVGLADYPALIERLLGALLESEEAR